MPSRRRVGGSLPLDPEARSVPAIAVLKADYPRPATRMRDKTFEDMLGEFVLKEKRKVKTGTVIGVWIEIDGGRALFQPHNLFVEKSYLK